MKTPALVAFAGLLLSLILFIFEMILRTNDTTMRHMSGPFLINTLSWIRLVVRDGALLYFFYSYLRQGTNTR